MGARRVVVRVIGFASTIRGFAYALTEGPGCLVDVSNCKTPAKGPKLERAIDTVLLQSRPLFVAIEHMSGQKQERYRQFSDALADCCEEHEIKLVTVRRQELLALTGLSAATKWDVASAMAERFPEIAYRLPKRRTPWRSEDDRLGIFTALAAAMWIWRGFRPPPPQAGEGPEITSSAPPLDAA